MRTPYTVYIMFKYHVGIGWELTDNLYFDKKDGEEAAKRFTEESIGWRYRVRPFKEVV